MAAPIVATMPPGIELDGGYVLRLTAIDATTGNVVAGVKISGVVITGDDLTAPMPLPDDETVAQVAPLFVPIPNEELAAQGG